MRILIVTNGFPPLARAGVESHSYALAQGVQAAGHTVRVFCRDAHTEGLEPYSVRTVEVDGLAVTRVVNTMLDVSRYDEMYRNARIEAIFAAVLADFEPDVVHVQHCIGLSIGCLELATRRYPTVVTLHDYWYICPTVQLVRRGGAQCAGTHHGADCFDCVAYLPEDVSWRVDNPVYHRVVHRWMPPTWRPEIHQRVVAWQAQRSRGKWAEIYHRAAAMRAALEGAQAILAVSEHVKNRYIGFGIDPALIQVEPLGMEVGRWQAVVRTPVPPPTPLRLGYVGTIQAVKGLDVVLRALQRVQGDVTLEIYGFEPPAEPYVQTVRKLAARDGRVTYGGPLANNDLPTTFARWDALVMPAQWEETFSFVTREALLAGLPVIGSDLPVLSDLIRHGENGYLVAAREVSAWTTLVQKLCDDPMRLRALDVRGVPIPARTQADYLTMIERLYKNWGG